MASAGGGAKKRVLGELDILVNLANTTDAASNLADIANAIRNVTAERKQANIIHTDYIDILQSIENSQRPLTRDQGDMVDILYEVQDQYLNVFRALDRVTKGKTELKDLTDYEIIQLGLLTKESEQLLEAGKKSNILTNDQIEALKNRHDIIKSSLAEDKSAIRVWYEQSEASKALFGGMGQAVKGAFSEISGSIKDTTGLLRVFTKSAETLGKSVKTYVTETFKNIGFEKLTDIKKLKGLFGPEARAKLLKNAQAMKLLGANASLTSGTLAVAGAKASMAGIAFAGFAAAVAAAGASLVLMAKGLSDNISRMEMFRQVNFRALGSISELMNASYDVSIATGLTADETSKAIVALSQAGITSRELAIAYGDSSQALRNLTATNGMFVKATGASEASVAGLQKQMVTLNFNEREMTELTGAAIIAMKEFGISGQDANVVLGQLTKSLMGVEAIYNKSQIKDYTMNIIELAGAAKRAGIDVSEVGTIIEELEGMKGPAFSLIAMSGSMEEYLAGGMAMADINKAMAEGYREYVNSLEGLGPAAKERAIRALGLSKERRKMLESEIKDMDYLESLSAEAYAAEMARRAQLRADDERRSALLEEYNSSMQTLTQQIQMVLAPALSKAAKMMEGFVKWMTEGVSVFKPMMSLIDDATDTIMMLGSEIGEIFGPMMPIFNMLGSAIYIVAKSVFFLLKPLIKVGGLLLKAIFWPLMKIGNSMEGTFGNFGKLIRDVNYAFEILGEWMEPFYQWLDSMGSEIDKIIDGTYALGDAFSQGLTMIGDLIAWAFKPFFVIKDSIFEAIAAVEQFAAAPGWNTATKAIIKMADAFINLIPGVGQLKAAIFGSSFLHIKEDLSEATLPALKALEAGIFKPIAPAEKLKSAFAAAWDAFVGGEDKPGSTDLVTATSASPVYTVQFDKDAAGSSDWYLKEMVMIQIEQARLLTEILNKKDPNNERTANAIEKLAEDSDNINEEVKVFRNRKGFGEGATQWWGDR